MGGVQRRWMFWVFAILFIAAAAAATFLVKNEYPFFAGYVILQCIVLATAWNILGGYAGYVNFGPSTAVAMPKAHCLIAVGLAPIRRSAISSWATARIARPVNVCAK